MTQIVKSCTMCERYQHEEIGDSDFGAIYSAFASCRDNIDVNPVTDELLRDFDRECERVCCKLDFWRTIEQDKELDEIIICDRGDTTRAYEHFKTKYFSNDTE